MGGFFHYAGAGAGDRVKVFVDGIDVGRMKTNLGGKLNVSVELNPGQTSQIKVKKL